MKSQTTEEKERFISTLRDIYPEAAVIRAFLPCPSSNTSSSSTVPALTTPSSSTVPALTTPSSLTVPALTIPSSALTTPSSSTVPALTTPSSSTLSSTLPIKKLPRLISSYFHPKYAKYPPKRLEEECKRIFAHEMKVTTDESVYLANATRLQSQSTFWWEYKKGLLTSSKFKAILRTKVVKPAKSLVEEILLRKQVNWRIPALAWGMENEDVARRSYHNIVAKNHTHFILSATGLHINPKYPHLGASPDGLISCSCCGDGVLEIKCPFSVSKGLPTECYYLEDNKLSRKHDYYYQVQGQMGILERSYCDFAVWTPQDLFIERIAFDQLFFDTMKMKLNKFFLHVILPKVLTASQQLNHPSEEDQVFCFCRRGEFQEMIMCDNPSCKFGWFHFSCVDLTVAPVGSWFCPDCLI